MKKILLLLLLGTITIGTVIYANDTEGPSGRGDNPNEKINYVEG